ncbi:hypothetical protein ABZ078_28320, partial [Streptomyces sp. NPDC006385]|uniref:hypothetical protein n=1 Tax=Streptomyces sp. NPDC006385 TaxID=3156761 RepID=UPI0033A7A921
MPGRPVAGVRCRPPPDGDGPAVTSSRPICTWTTCSGARPGRRADHMWSAVWDLLRIGYETPVGWLAGGM